MPVLVLALATTVVAAAPAAAASVPARPAMGSALGSDGTITVTFAAPRSTGGSALVGYTASCTPVAGGPPSTATGPASPLVVGGLTNGTAHSCTVVATNALGDSAPSTARVATPYTFADPPTFTGVDASHATLRFTLAPPAADGGSPVSRYAVSCTPTGGGETRVGRGPGPVAVTGLTNGVEYSCVARSSNSAGLGPAGGATTGTPVGIPSAPNIGTVSPGDGRLDVAFGAPSTAGDSTVTAYTASCRPTAGGTPATATGATSPVPVTGLTNGTAYACSVAARNASGDSPASAERTGTPRSAPGAPTATATGSDGSANVAVVAGTDGGEPPGAVSASCSATGQPTGEAGPVPGTAVRVAGLTNGVEYSCVARTHNGAGASPASAAVTVTPLGPPSPPQLTLVAAGDSSVSAAFTVPVRDGGAPVAGYTLACRAPGVAELTAAGGASPLTVTGLVNGTEYRCSVTASNGTVTSPPSAAWRATPLGPPGIPAGVTATGTDGRILVSVPVPAAPPAAPVTRYLASCTDGTSTISATSTSSPVPVDGLTNGVEYTCVGRAGNKVGDSAASAPAAATPRGLPRGPQLTSVTGRDASVRIGFLAPNGAGSSIQGYDAQCVVGRRTMTGSGLVSPVVVTGLTNGTTYQCSVRARTAQGPGGWSAARSVVPVAPPSMPEVTSVVVEGTSATVRFGASRADGGSPVLDHTARCSDHAGADRSATVAAQARVAVVTGLVAGGTYTCYVTARNAAGSSNTVTVVPQDLIAAAALVGTSGAWESVSVSADGVVVANDDFERPSLAGGPQWAAVPPYSPATVSGGQMVNPSADPADIAAVSLPVGGLDVSVEGVVGRLPGTEEDGLALVVSRPEVLPVADFVAVVLPSGGLLLLSAGGNDLLMASPPGVVSAGSSVRITRAADNAVQVLVDGQPLLTAPLTPA